MYACIYCNVSIDIKEIRLSQSALFRAFRQSSETSFECIYMKRKCRAHASESHKPKTLYVPSFHSEITMPSYFIKRSTHLTCCYVNERKSEQAHIPHAPTLLENAVYNEWQFHALVTGNRAKKGI